MTLYNGSAWLYLNLLHSNMALLSSTALQLTIHSTVPLLRFTWFYSTPLHCTYHGSTWFYLTPLYYTLPWIYIHLSLILYLYLSYIPLSVPLSISIFHPSVSVHVLLLLSKSLSLSLCTSFFQSWSLCSCSSVPINLFLFYLSQSLHYCPSVPVPVPVYLYMFPGADPGGAWGAHAFPFRTKPARNAEVCHALSTRSYFDVMHISIRITASCPAYIECSNLQLPSWRDSSVAAQGS